MQLCLTPDVWFEKTLQLAKLTLFFAAQLGPGFRMCCLHFQKRYLVSWVCQKWFNFCSATNLIWFIQWRGTHWEYMEGQSFLTEKTSLPCITAYLFASCATKLKRKSSLTETITAKTRSLIRKDDKRLQKLARKNKHYISIRDESEGLGVINLIAWTW